MKTIFFLKWERAVGRLAPSGRSAISAASNPRQSSAQSQGIKTTVNPAATILCRNYSQSSDNWSSVEFQNVKMLEVWGKT